MIGAILLAAGESARLGEPKQLLRFRGETLLRRSVRVARAATADVVVALGANRELMRAEISDLPVGIAENPHWKEGMSGSLKIALGQLLERNENLCGVLLMVCDQPLVDEELLARMIERLTNDGDALIVACEYQNTLGVPALFRRALFPEMLRLDSRSGAKQIIKTHRRQTVTVPFPEGALDIDTPSDYARMLARFDR